MTPTHRVCTKCHQTKPLTDFSPHAHGKYGRQPRCKACCLDANIARYWGDPEKARAQSRESAAEYRQRHPDRKKESHDRWVRENPDKDKEAKRKYAENNAEALRARRSELYKASPSRRESNRAWREANRTKVRDYSLKHKIKRAFGLSMEAYAALLLAQGHRCAVCGTEFATMVGRRPHLDHDHVTGAIREILCRACNHGIGNFKDDPELLQLAIDYLRRHKK